ncbi:MAG: helix-turn-helix domain-containing protein [Planctomycetota bacterium]|jgi:predicted DNA-binding transcriptional regulator AlpA
MIQLPNADLLSEMEFAALIGKSLRTVRRWHVERRGPRRTLLGRSVFYSRKAIEAFLQRQEQREEQP